MRTQFFNDLLDIPLALKVAETLKVQSIVLKSSKILFTDKLYNSFQTNGLIFNLVDFTGMFITKMDSCPNPKRARDSFDIYMAFKNEAVDFELLKFYQSKRSNISESLKKFISFLERDAEIFNKNVSLFGKPIDSSPAKYILNCLDF